MNWTRRRGLLFCLTILLGAVLGTNGMAKSEKPVISLQHLQHLQQEIVIEGKPCLAVWIYCEAPNYTPVGDDDEGFACVDDVARAARLYLELYDQQGDTTLIPTIEGLLRFVLALQAEDGEFRNFVWEDGSINREHRTSQKSRNWWAARGFRSLSNAMLLLPDSESEFAAELKNATELTVNRLLEVNRDSLDTTHLGYDLAAEWILGLLDWREATGSDRVDGLLVAFGDFLVSGWWSPPPGGEGFPYALHRSWQNIWHSWGMLQVEALARAGDALGRDGWISLAVREGIGFQRYLIVEGMWNELHFGAKDTTMASRFPAIAYGVGSLVACQTALYEVTNDSAFAYSAGLAATWFRGENPTGQPMIEFATGRGYDGIISADDRNLNAGAESTIEALLALALIKRHAQAGRAWQAVRVEDKTLEKTEYRTEDESIILRRMGDCWILDAEPYKLEKKQAE